MTKIRKPTSSPASSKRPIAGRSGKQKTANTGATVAAGIGWVLFVAAAAASIAVNSNNAAGLAAVKASLPLELKKVQEDVNARQEAISTQRADVSKKINACIKKQLDLDARAQALELFIKDLKPSQQQLAAQADKIKDSVDAVREDASLAGGGLEGLTKKLDDLNREKRRLVDEYVQHYKDMQAAFEEKISRPEPDLMRAFYTTHRHTPFGPAAGYIAAEKLYEAKRSKDALRFYEDVQKRYPDSSYAEMCMNRIAEIQARKKYEGEVPTDFTPYKALPVIENGE